MSEVGVEPWTLAWPAGADRVERSNGNLVFELRGYGKAAWEAGDVAAAQRCYEGQRVYLAEADTLLIVEPPTV